MIILLTLASWRMSLTLCKEMFVFLEIKERKLNTKRLFYHLNVSACGTFLCRKSETVRIHCSPGGGSDRGLIPSVQFPILQFEPICVQSHGTFVLDDGTIYPSPAIISNAIRLISIERHSS